MVTGAYYPEVTGGALQCRTLIQALGGRVGVSMVSVSSNPALPAHEMLDGVWVSRICVDPDRLWSRITAGVRLGWSFFRSCRHADVVHFHGFTQKSVLLVAIAKLLGKPIMMKAGGVGQDDPATIRKRGALLWRFYSTMDRFVATSPALESAMHDAQLPDERIERIPNGVDLRRFRPAEPGERDALRQEFGLPAELTLILFVGMLAPVKRPELLLEAWMRIGPAASRSALLYVGTTSNFREIDAAIGHRIRARADAAGVGDRVRFLDTTLAIERLYRAADIFVLPSATEGHPNALLEAMASGLACVASRLPGITDSIVEDGSNGVLVASGEAAPMADAIRTLIEQPDRRVEIGRHARETIESRYGIEGTAAAYLNLYERLTPYPDRNRPR